ncbi:2-oxoglutarate and iron-dependent oxygenase domain-containing protein [Tistrella mobilis]|uniref:isopenicillin N synthase family dioxygenase n=1 Tax=Tistrella mobilis TaxID=171437 RepID=UPI00355612C6
MAVVQTGNGPRELVDSGLDARSLAFTEIPVIDFGALVDPASTPAECMAVGDAVRDACTRVGFFYVRNHGVDPAVIAGTYGAARDFFALPMDEKMRIHIRKSKNHRGYVPLLEENTDPTAKGDLHEAFDMALEVPADDADVLAGKTMYGPNVWPELDGFRPAMEGYYDAVYQLGRRIFRGFALALGLAEDHFEPLIRKPMAQLRVVHYPPQQGPIDERQIGIGAHSDYECFTILNQMEGVSALQVLNGAGEWIEAPPIPGTFIINVGDQMARWTNDVFASTIHRAINRSGRERYSIPFFFGPDYDTPIEVLDTCTTPERPARYPTVTSGAYILSRFDETFAYRKAGEPEPAG